MPHNEVEVRLAKSEDSEQLWPLVREFAISYRPERSAFDLSFRELVGRTDTLILVAASTSGAILGYLLGSFHGTIFANGPVA